jgi:hypothetical protein
MAYLFAPRRPPFTKVDIHPSASSWRNDVLTARSQRPVFRDKVATEGQHSPSSLALSANAKRTSRFVGPTSAQSQTADIILILIAHTSFGPGIA